MKQKLILVVLNLFLIGAVYSQAAYLGTPINTIQKAIAQQNGAYIFVKSIISGEWISYEYKMIKSSVTYVFHTVDNIVLSLEIYGDVQAVRSITDKWFTDFLNNNNYPNKFKLGSYWLLDEGNGIYGSYHLYSRFGSGGNILMRYMSLNERVCDTVVNTLGG